MGVTVDAPDGVRWSVRRRWANGRLLRFVDASVRARRQVTAGLDRESGETARRAASAPNPPVGSGMVEVATNSAGLSAIGTGAGAVAGSAVLWVAEMLLRVVVLPFALAGHLVFRRPWTIEATADWTLPIRRSVVGWTASRRAVDALATELRSGALTSPLTLDGKHPAEHVDHTEG